MHLCLHGPLTQCEVASMEKKDSKKCLSDAEDEDERFLHQLFNKTAIYGSEKTLFEQASA